MDKQIKFIADHYGTHHQLLKLSEEMSEVNIEITKLLSTTEDKEILNIYRNTLPEELADLSLVLDQVIYLLDCKARVDAVRKYKAVRQIRRIRLDTNQN